MNFLYSVQANILLPRKTSPKLRDRPALLNLNLTPRSRTTKKITAWTPEFKFVLN